MRIRKGDFTVIHTPTMGHLSAIELGVYAWLCHYTNQEGTCFPSLKTLCLNTRMSKMGIVRVLKRIEQKGAIKRIRRAGKKHGFTSTMYYLVLLPPLVTLGDKPSKQGLLPLVTLGDNNQSKVELNKPNRRADIKINRGTESVKEIIQRTYGHKETVRV